MSSETNLSSWARVLQRGRKPGRPTGRWRKVEEKETSLPNTWLYLEEKTVAIWQIMKGNQIFSLQKRQDSLLSACSVLQNYSYYFCSMQYVHCDFFVILLFCYSDVQCLVAIKKHIAHYYIISHKALHSTWPSIPNMMNKSEVLCNLWTHY